MSLNIEFTTFQSAWYTHHIDAKGCSNDGVKMGQCWGTRKDPNDGISGQAGSICLDWQNSSESQISILYRRANFN
jgi:hypothetical protein